MNRIYKVIWSKVKNCYVVVSEIAKRNSKSTVNSGFSVTRNILAGAVVLGLTAGVCAPAWAAVDVDNNKKIGINQLLPFIVYASDKNLLTINEKGEVIFKNSSNHELFHISDANNIVYWGAPTSVTGQYATAWGQGTTASGQWSTAWGDQTRSTGADSTAFGQLTRAEGKGSTAWGANTQAHTGDNTTAFGQWSEATGRDATAFGYNTYAKGEFATTWGNGAWTSGHSANPGWDPNSRGLIAEGQSSTAFGYSTYAKGLESTAFGHLTDAIGEQSTSWGHTTHAIGNESTAFGEQTTAAGNHGTAFGYMTEVASGTDNAVAWGESTRASASHATAFGYHTQAVAQGTLATGMNTIANGNYSSAFGQNTRAIGAQSIAFGYGNAPAVYNTTKVKVGNDEYNTVVAYPTNVDVDPATYRGIAKGEDSVAGMGGSTYANSQYSFAYGADAKASGNSALAFGENAKAGIDGSYEGAIALGKNTVSAKNGVALGNKSVVTTTHDSTPGYNFDKKTVDGGGIWTPTEGNLSIGNVNAQGVGQTRRIQGVAAGYADTDAVNVAQLKTVVGGAVAGVETVVKPGTNVTSTPKTTEDGHPVYTVNVDNLGYKVNGTAATPVKIKDGINFVDGKNTTAELKNGNSVTFNAYDTKVVEGTGVTVTGGEADGKNVRTYTVNTKPMTFGAESGTFEANLGNGSAAPVKVVGDGDAVTTKVENNAIKVEVDKAKILEDGNLKFAGDDGKVITKKNGERLDVVGGADDKASEDNIYTENKDGQIHINLAKDIEGVDKITVNNEVKVGGNTVINGDTITTTNITGETVNTKTINLGPTDNSTSITYNKEGDRISYGDNIIATLGDGMNYGGDFNKPEGGRVSVALDKNVDVKGNAPSEKDLVDGNIGVVAEAVGEDAQLTVKLKKDIDLGDEGSVTIGGTKVTNNSVTTTNVIATTNITTPKITLGDTTNNTVITYNTDGRISYTKGGDTYNVANTKDIGWNAFVQKKDATTAAAEAGTVDIDHKKFTFVEGNNVTITPDKDKNQITISAETDLSGVQMQFAGDDAKNDDGTGANTKVITKKNGERLDVVGGADDKASEDNIYTENKDGQIHINLAKDIEGVDKITVNNEVKVGGNTVINGDTITTTNITGETVNTKTINLGPTDNSTSITYNKEGDRISYGDNIIATLGDGMNYGGDFNKPEGGRVSVALDKNVDVKGNAPSEKDLVDGNIGVVAEAVGEDAQLTVKLKKDIDLGDEGSVTIGGTKVTNNSVTTTNVTATTNITTPQITLGDTKITYEGGTTNRIKYGDKYIANTEDVAWTAYVGSVADGNKAGTVNIDNPNFTFVAGDNVTIKPEAGKNQITIAAIGIEAGDGIAVTKDSTTNKYKISLNIEGGVTPTDTVTVNSATSSGSETTGGETSGSGAAGEGAADSGTAGSSTDTGKTVTITSDTNSTAFTDDKGETYVTVKPTSIDDKTSAANNLQIKGDGKNISTVATSNGQDEGGSIQVKLNSDITVDNVTVNNTVKAKTINATTIAGDTINATTVNGDTVNTQTIKLGDTTIKQGDDNRITYNTKSGDTYNIATLEDGMDFAGDDGKTIHKNLADQLDIVGGAAEKASKDNIYTYNDNGKIHINLAKDIEGVDTVTVNKTINVGGNTTITGDTITTKTVNVGDTTINNNGVTIKNGPSITKNGIDAGGKKITNVAPGTDGTDAVNVDQLNSAISQVGGDAINRLGDQMNRLDNSTRKGIAGAAALAALHPLDFDPDDKWEFSAGVGNYRGETAAAIGAFYHPNDDTIFSLGATVGNGENLVNGGVTFRFGQQNHQSRSKKAMAKEIVELRAEVAELKAMVYSMANGRMPGLDLTKSEEFPDTPENHWAYDYVSVLAGNGVLEGYQDGFFKGDRTLTRYEMAAIIYRAMMRGVDVDERMKEEFAPELARVKVDTLTSHSDGTPSIQRVRVIKGRE
ncbi:ESPR-type extended signal peptide-containing protein [Megasphaera elsdenii]|uniref:ESPR-type extended signal peptide-containing protein n=1 Tax=Megasphaera elsdenii TaxID=907 RepID=UPI004035E97F